MVRFLSLSCLQMVHGWVMQSSQWKSTKVIFRCANSLERDAKTCLKS